MEAVSFIAGAFLLRSKFDLNDYCRLSGFPADYIPNKALTLFSSTPATSPI